MVQGLIQWVDVRMFQACQTADGNPESSAPESHAAGTRMIHQTGVPHAQVDARARDR